MHTEESMAFLDHGLKFWVPRRKKNVFYLLKDLEDWVSISVFFFVIYRVVKKSRPMRPLIIKNLKAISVLQLQKRPSHVRVFARSFVSVKPVRAFFFFLRGTFTYAKDISMCQHFCNSLYIDEGCPKSFQKHQLLSSVQKYGTKIIVSSSAPKRIAFESMHFWHLEGNDIREKVPVTQFCPSRLRNEFTGPELLMRLRGRKGLPSR